MNKTRKEVYELALSKMAIPTCECLLAARDTSSFNTKKNDNKEKKNDSSRTSRTRIIQAEAQNTIPLITQCAREQTV